MRSIRTMAATGLAVALALVAALPASAAEGEEGVYDGPTEVFESMTAAEALETLQNPPIIVEKDGLSSGTGTVSPSCIACVGGAGYQSVIVSGPIKYTKRFVGYLTPAWAYSTGYSWSATTTVSATLSASVGTTAKAVATNVGVSASRSQAYSITVNIYADRTRMSKLGLYSDFNRYYTKTRSYIGGSYGTWKYAYLYSPLANQYLIATYL